MEEAKWLKIPAVSGHTTRLSIELTDCLVWKGDITPAITGPHSGENAKWLHNPCRLGGTCHDHQSNRQIAQCKWLYNPYRLGCPIVEGTKWQHDVTAIDRADQPRIDRTDQLPGVRWLHNPYGPRGPMVEKTQNGYIVLAFSTSHGHP